MRGARKPPGPIVQSFPLLTADWDILCCKINFQSELSFLCTCTPLELKSLLTRCMRVSQVGFLHCFSVWICVCILGQMHTLISGQVHAQLGQVEASWRSVLTHISYCLCASWICACSSGQLRVHILYLLQKKTTLDHRHQAYITPCVWRGGNKIRCQVLGKVLEETRLECM